MAVFCLLMLTSACHSAPPPEASTKVTPISHGSEQHPYGLMDIQGKHGKGEWRQQQPLR